MVNIDTLISVAIIIAIFMTLIILIPMIIFIAKQKTENDVYQKALDESINVTDSDLKQIEYSEKSLDYYNKLISAVCITSFQDWMDNRQRDKITKAQFQNLVETSAKLVFESIEYNKLRNDILLYTDTFYTWYITHVTIHTLKHILEERAIIIED